LAKSENEQPVAAVSEIAPQPNVQEPDQAPRQQERRPPEHQAQKPRQPDPGENRHEKSHRQKQEKPSGQPHQKSSNADLSDLLKQIQSRYNELRDELRTARNQLHQSQQSPKQGESRSAENSKEVGKLREENARLTEMVTSLRETLSELASENFDEAVSRKADTEAPVTDPVEQFKSLLTLKVREQIVNFKTLNRENHIDGLPLLLDNILRTLQESGIDLENIGKPPPEVKRKY